MAIRILLSSDGAAAAAHLIDGPVTIGGSRADGIPVPALPPAALHVDARPAGLLLRPTTTGLRVGGRGVPPGSRRLLRPGERASLRGLSLELPVSRPDVPTRVAAAALLRSEGGDGLPAGPRLVVLSGPDAGEHVAAEGDLVIGRGRSAALRVRDPAASRRHARVHLEAGCATVEDLGAKNPLKVNGVRIERCPTPLRGGDRLTIGQTEVVYEEDPSPPLVSRVPCPAPVRRKPGRRASPLMAAALLAAAATALAIASSCWG